MGLSDNPEPRSKVEKPEDLSAEQWDQILNSFPGTYMNNHVMKQALEKLRSNGNQAMKWSELFAGHSWGEMNRAQTYINIVFKEQNIPLRLNAIERNRFVPAVDKLMAILPLNTKMQRKPRS